MFQTFHSWNYHVCTCKMFAPAKCLRKWHEQHPSNKGDLDSRVMGEVERVCYMGVDLVFWFNFCTSVHRCWVAFEMEHLVQGKVLIFLNVCNVYSLWGQCSAGDLSAGARCRILVWTAGNLVVWHWSRDHSTGTLTPSSSCCPRKSSVCSGHWRQPLQM
jgi:hypothetical protein